MLQFLQKAVLLQERCAHRYPDHNPVVTLCNSDTLYIGTRPSLSVMHTYSTRLSLLSVWQVALLLRDNRGAHRNCPDWCCWHKRWVHVHI